MKVFWLVAVPILVGVLTGCSLVEGNSVNTHVTVVPNSAKPATGVVGSGFKLSCDPKLETVSIADGDTNGSWKGVEVGYYSDGFVMGEGNDATYLETSVDVAVYGDIAAESAIIHFDQYYTDSENKFIDYKNPPVAVNWPYDAKGVRVTFDTGDFDSTGDFKRVDLCVKSVQ